MGENHRSEHQAETTWLIWMVGLNKTSFIYSFPDVLLGPNAWPPEPFKSQNKLFPLERRLSNTSAVLHFTSKSQIYWNYDFYLDLDKFYHNSLTDLDFFLKEEKEVHGFPLNYRGWHPLHQVYHFHNHNAKRLLKPILKQGTSKTDWCLDFVVVPLWFAITDPNEWNSKVLHDLEAKNMGKWCGKEN